MALMCIIGGKVTMEPMNNYNLLSKDVYDVDLSKGGMYREGKILDNTNYEILDISRNGTYGNKNQYGVFNHMQAMTVAPNYIGANYAKK